MHIALITTTINLPKVLEAYAALTGSDERWTMIVAGDLKTSPEAEEFCEGIDDCEYLTPEWQKDMGYKCSELIGWNTDSRRNIALLEAIKYQPDLIISID